MWYIGLVLFHKYSHLYIDLVFISIIIGIFGTIFTYVMPRRFVIVLDDRCFVIQGTECAIIDALMHHMPVLLILYIYGFDTWAGLGPSMAVLCLVGAYFLLYNPDKVYGVHTERYGRILRALFVIITTIYLSVRLYP
jgi:hypothetical protein